MIKLGKSTYVVILQKYKSIKIFFAILVLVIFALSVSSANVAFATSGTPSIINYQGRLTDSSGNLLGGAGTTYYFKFSLWDSATVSAGNKLWPTVAPTSVSATVKQGVFNVDIGDVAGGYPQALDYNFNTNKDIYLQVEVSTDNATFQTLGPRQHVTSAVFAELSGAVSGVGQSSIGTTTPVSGAVATVQSTTTSSVALVVRGADGQASDILQAQDSLGNSLLSLSALGGFQIKNLANCNTIDTDANGNLSCGTDEGGSGSSFAWPFTAATGYVSTSTALGFVGANSFFATGSSTISGAFHLPSLGAGGLAVSSAGLVYSGATTTAGTGLSYSAGAFNLDLANANTWTALQQFNSNASSTLFSANQAWFGGTGTTTITNAGWIGVGTTSPTYALSVEGTSTAWANIAGYFTGTTTATSTLAGGLQTNLLKVTSTIASSTFANGIELTTGCFAINGACLSGGAGGGTVTSIDVSGGTTGLTFADGPVTTTGVITMSGILAATNGGTGWGNIQANTILLGNGTGAFATTSAGTDGQILALVGGVPTWQATTTFSGGLTYSNGNVTSDLGTNIDLASAEVTGMLGVANGGTGASTFTSSQLLYGAGSGAIQSVATTSLTASGALSLSNPISVLGSVSSALTCATANGSTAGCLSSGDWATFNSKISSQWTTAGSDIYYNTGAVGIGTNSLSGAKFKVAFSSLSIIDTYNNQAKIANISNVSVSSSKLQLAQAVCGSYTVSGSGSDSGKTYGTVVGEDGNCWLDRNLGATQVATAYNDTASYGYYYQWGRGTDGHQIENSSVTPLSGVVTTASAVSAPYNAYFVATSTGSTYFDWLNQQNNALWQGVNGTNNPCPSGFRLPTQTEWTHLITTHAGITTASCNGGNACLTTLAASKLKIPAAGYRYRTNGSLANRGSGGYYWSSSVAGSYAYNLNFLSSYVDLASNNGRAYGFSLRCIKDY